MEELKSQNFPLLLSSLLPEHIFRNIPLGQLQGLHIRNKGSKQWRPISRFKIKRSSYNNVTAWHAHNEFAIL